MKDGSGPWERRPHPHHWNDSPLHYVRKIAIVDRVTYCYFLLSWMSIHNVLVMKEFDDRYYYNCGVGADMEWLYGW